MTLGEYLRSRFALLGVVAVACAMACGIAGVCGANAATVVTIAGCLLAGVVAGSVWDYARSARFYRDLKNLPDQLEHTYQLPELMNDPVSVDQVIVHDALRAMGSAATEEAGAAARRSAEQREYMEVWVHEVKTPLAAASLVAERVTPEESAALKRELDRATSQVDQVLWYARSLSAEKDYVIRETSLADIARASCKQHARFLIEKGVTPSVEIDDGLRVFADEKQAGFVVSQVVVNAAKYGAHRLEFSATEVTDEAGARVVELCIADDGRGIPAADVPRVFERGFTGTRGREVGSSTGMGLYLAAKMCAKLGLGITLASEEGVGTRVLIAFPYDDRRIAMEAGE